MSDSQKEKLSAINKGKTLSQQTRQRISKSMEKYWNSLPYKPTSGATTGITGSFGTYLEN